MANTKTGHAEAMARAKAETDARKEPRETLEAEEAGHVWAVWTNTDLIEGRGERYVLWASTVEATARRLARGNYVQGADCPVEKLHLYRIGGAAFCSVSVLRMVRPSPDDLENEYKTRARRAAIERAREAGLTEDEISLLLGHRP